MSGSVSCLTVTKERLDLLPRAVTCFPRQSYPERELIVVNDAEEGTKEYVASLRDEYVAQWDDDDWHHPDRLAEQLAKLEPEEVDICLLQRWTLAWPERNLFVRSKRRPWEGTMVAHRESLSSYEELSHGEDSVVVEACRKRGQKVCILDRPDLCLYVVHGRNTYPADHFAHNIFNVHTGELSAEEFAEASRQLEWGRSGS